jgi:hypothetical protein
VQVDAVEERPRQSPAVALDRRRAARTLAQLRAGPAARARVGRGDEQEAAREPQGRRRAPDDHLALLERLAQGLDRRALELGQLVEEQHAAVGQRDLAGPRHAAAAEQRRRRHRVVRAAERPLVDEAARRRADRE